MSLRSPVKLAALRHIGWTYWDPIGLSDLVGPDYNEGPYDEYDSYLITAFGMIQGGKSDHDVAAYLAQIAADHMGLGALVDSDTHANRTVSELRKLLSSLT